MEIVGFVILHYGDIRVTKMCTDSILQLDTKDDIRIVIVDNDYQKMDEDREKLNRQYQNEKRIDILRIYENIGFSRANNKGYAYLKKKYAPKYVIVTNNDIEFKQRNFIDEVKETYAQHPCEVLSPDIISRENGEHQSPIDVSARSIGQLNYTIYMNAISLKLFPVIYPLLRMNHKRTKTGKKDIQQDKKEMVQRDIVPCGACIIVSGRFLEQEEKIFSPETQFYYEEYILHERCRRKDYQILYNPDICVLHGDGVATKRKAGNERKRIRFMMKHTLEAAKIYKKFMQGK